MRGRSNWVGHDLKSPVVVTKFFTPAESHVYSFDQLGKPHSSGVLSVVLFKTANLTSREHMTLRCSASLLTELWP